MDIIKHIDNKFVAGLYSSKDFEGATLGFFSFNNSGQLSLDLHIDQKPMQAIKKWGEWGNSYNVVVIKLILQGIKNINLKNIHDLTVLGLKEFTKKDSSYRLTFEDKTGDQFLEVEYMTCIFQGSAKYLNDEPAS